MKVTCALTQSQIEKLYANVYGHMLNQGEAFDAKQYMTDLFNKIAKKKDVDTAAKFLQQVPSLIGTASFRPSIEEFEISTDMLRPLIKQFKKDDNGLINTVNYFNPSLNPDVKKELVEKKANDAFEVRETTSSSVPVDPLSYQPYSALSTTFQEFISLDPNKPIGSETLDPGKRTIYTTLSAIKDNANNNTPLKELVYQDTVLKLKPIRLSDIDPETLDKTTKRLVSRADFLKKSGQAQSNVTTPDEIFLMVITDNEGNQLFFDEKGNITTKELGGTLVYQFLREVRSEGGKYRVTDIYGKRDQIMDPAIIAEKAGITVEEATARQQKEFEELYMFRAKLIADEIDPLLDIVGVSTGVSDIKPESLNLSNLTLTLEDNDDAIRTLDTVKSPRAGLTKGESVITIKGIEYKVDRPNLTADVARKIAAILTSKKMTNKEKYKIVSQFLADKASLATRKHSLEYLPNTDTLIYKYSPTTFQEGYNEFIPVNLDAPKAADDIYKSLMEASGSKGKYFPAKMTFNKEALDRNGFQDFNLETGELNDDYSNYIEFLKGLPNTKIFLDVTPSSRSFNSYMGFALPNQFTDQLAKAQENTDSIVKDDFFETLVTPEDAAPVLGVRETREKIISILQNNQQVKGTISKPFGSITKWHLTTPKGNIIEFYNQKNDITAEDINAVVSLNLLPEAEFNGKKFTNVIEVRNGDKLLGYVRETEDFDAPATKTEPTKTVEEIEAEINETIDPKGVGKPEEGGAADVFFFRKGELPSDVTEEQIEEANRWWPTSPLNKYIKFRQVANIVNSDAYARFTAYGATLNGKLGIIEIADKGSMVDVYHEAWHGFSQLFLTKAEKKALYKEVQKKLGTKADFFEIEEMLAEDFREYVRTGKVKANSPKRNSLFRKILNFLRELFGKGSVTDVTEIKTVKELFDKLYLGTDLNIYTPSIDNVMFDVLYRNSGIVKPGTQTDQVLNRQDSNLLKESMDSIISDIIDNQVQAKGTKAGTLSVLLDSRNREPLYKLVKVKLQAKLDNFVEQLNTTEDTTENAFKRELLENRIRIIQAGIDNYGDTKNGLIKYHVENSSYNLIRQKYTALELDEEGNLMEPANAADSQRYGDKKDGQKSLIELAGKETLYILKSLHQGKINKATNKVEYQYNELGFKKLADFRTTWNNTVKAIGGIQDPQQMYDKLVKVAETDPQFRQLVETKLANPNPNVSAPNMYEFQATTSIWQDFNKSRVPYIQLTVFKDKVGETEKVNQYTGEKTMIPKYEYTTAVTEASNESITIIRKFQDKFKASMTNPYVDRVGRDNIPTLNLQKVVDDFGVSGKLDTTKSYEFARAIGFYLDDLSIIKSKLNKDNKAIEQFGLPYIYDIIRRLNVKDKLDTTNSTAKSVILKFKTEPLQTLMDGIPENIIGTSQEIQKKQVREIANLQGKYGLDTSNGMVLNAERNLVSEYIENNTISKQVYALNNAKKLSDLWTSDEFQYMSYMNPATNPYTKRLATVRSLFELNDPQQRKRSGRSLQLFMDSGTQIENEDTGLNTTSLDVNSKFLQEMNTMLKDGVQEFMRHASKSSSFGAKVDGGIIGLPGKEGDDNNLWIDLNMFAKGSAYDYAFKAHILPYMEAEAERIFKFRQNKEEFSKYVGYNRDLGNGVMAGEVFTAFDNVLTTGSKDKIYAAIDKAIAEKKNFNLTEFLRNDTTGLLNGVRDNVKNYFNEQTNVNRSLLKDANYISKDLVEKMEGLGIASNEVQSKLVEAYTYNSWIQNFEMAVLFYGDMSQYNHDKEELHKRNTGSTSGGRAFRTDIASRAFVNDFLAKTSYAKKADMAPIAYNGTYNTAILQDVKRNSVYLGQIEKGLRADYEKRYKEAGVKNAAAEIDRRVKIELSKYENMEEGDGQGFISFDAYRTLKYLENDWSNEQEILFQRIVRGEEVNASDVRELFPVYKVQHFGHIANVGIPIIAMHKFALAPLIPSVIEGSDLQSLHEQMIKDNVQYVTFQTGSKVGSETSAVNTKGEAVADEIYDPKSDKKTLKKDIKFTKNTIYLENLKNVTAVPNKYKNKTVFSTQLRKLVLGGLYRNGKIINPKNEAAINRYEKAVDDYSNILKLELLHEIGYEYNEETKKYTGNLHDFLDVVQRELDRKDVPEHLVQMVGLNRDKSIKTDLSLHLMADEIEAILVSLVEKRLIKQKVKGEALVQVASSMSNGMWDSNLKKGTKEDILKYMGTNNLPFYNNDTTSGKTAAMKVAIALQGDFANLLKLNHLDGQPIGTRARLNDMIKEDKWLDLADNRKSVTLSAVRIPVQGLNSMEFMEVYEFLDPAAGNIIIPPTEIVAKSGADFDVDKLTTFMPAIDNQGNFVKTGITNEQVLAKVNNAEATPEGIKLATNLIKNQKAALENELISTIAGILELPDNYAALVRPNDTYLLKDELADKIQDYVIEYNRFGNMHKESNRIGKKGGKVISPTRTLEVSYNLHKHEVNMIGKRVLGLIAIENSLHPIFNSIGASLPATYKNQIFSKALQRNVDGTQVNQVRLLLPHNKTADGRVSLSGTDTADGLDNIADLFSQMMNGAVDVEKDPWIFFIQGNYEIAPMITFLFKAGVPREDAIMFVSNPLVREYAKQQRMIKSAYAKMTGTVKEDFPEAMAKYQAAVNTLEQRGIQKAGSLVSTKKYYNAVVNATSAPGILNENTEFDSEMMKELVKNPKAPELQDHAVAMFLHFLELEKSTRGFTALKFISNPDTKTSKTLQEIIRRNLSIEDAKAMSSLEQGTVDKMQDSILGTFYDNKLIGDLIVPLFPLRNNDRVTDFIVNASQTRQSSVIKTFGRGQDGTRRFITEFKNAIPNYIYQNYMSNFIDGNGNVTSMPEVFKKMPVVEKVGAKNGAEIIDGKLYVDKNRLSNEFKQGLYLRSNTGALGYTKQGLRGFGEVEGLFPNESTYFKYVFERELQRNLYPMNIVTANKDYLRLKAVVPGEQQAYEAYINQRALINAFNRKAIMGLPGQSYTDMVLDTVEEFSELKSKYPILTQFTKPRLKTGEIVLTLNDTKSLKDPQLAEIYFQNLTDLANEDVKKVINPEDNKRISKLFSMLPQMMMYQHGIGYSKYGFTKALPYKEFLGVMQTASEIFMDKQLNDKTLSVIFDKLVEPGNKVFKNLLVAPKQYLAPEPVKVKKEDELISEEAATALLDKMGVKSIEEADLAQSTTEPTQSSTLVKEGVLELFEEKPELVSIGTPEQYSEWINYLITQGKLAGTKATEILYHGSAADFETFISDNLGNNTKAKDADRGFAFSNDKKTAKTYGKNIKSVILNAQNIEKVSPISEEYEDIIKPDFQSLEEQITDLKKSIAKQEKINNINTVEELPDSFYVYSGKAKSLVKIAKEDNSFYAYVDNKKINDEIDDKKVLSLFNTTKKDTKKLVDKLNLLTNKNTVFLYKNIIDARNIESTDKNDVYFAKPEQIYELGGKEDVEGFKKFVTQPSAGVKIKEIIPAYGAVQVSTNPTKEFDKYLTDAISDNIKNNAYVENGSSSANLMFSYGWQWKGNNSKQVIGDRLIVQPAQVDFSGKGNPVAVKSKYFYDSRYNDSALVPPISELNFLKKHIEDNLGIDMSDYDIALNNIYTEGTNLFRHTDIDESNTAKNYPVVVYVLGNEHKVRIDDNGGAAVRGMGEMVNPKTLTLKNGDIYTFGMDGKGRFEAVHDVIRSNKTDSSFPPITLPNGKTINKYTVTFTFRRAADLEPGMPDTPAKLTNEPTSDTPITGEITNTNAPEGLPGIDRTSTDCQ
jgi:hypothetical protein